MLKITVVSDENSWINAYIPSLLEALDQNGCKTGWHHRVKDIPTGDLVFYLGCGQLVPAEILARNRHNLVIHESALPEGRGWSPLTWQILEGKDDIPISLFEAGEKVDSGQIYVQGVMKFSGHELVDELRKTQAEASIRLCLEFVQNFPEIISTGSEQKGEATYYARRRPEDSRLDFDKTLREQFNLLRIVDNESYPAFFELDGHRYHLKVSKIDKSSD